MTRHAVLRLADSILLAASVVFLHACSGAVSGGTSPSTGPVVVSPQAAVLYSDTPTTFNVTGGNGQYIASSSDQQALPVAGTFTGSSLTVVPNTVGADTTVILTVRDTAASTAATASLTIKPRTVSNVVTLTPSGGTACGTAVCAGGDAQVQVVLAQAGIPLVGHTVRFDVVSGDIRVIVASPGQGDVLATSGIAVTDSTGAATIRVRALDTAATQTALLDVTDTSSGSTTRTGVPIVSTAAALSAQPSTIAFQGPTASACANGNSADILISGGKAPYTISQPAGFVVTPSIVTSNPGRATVTATGQCSAGASIVALDANGASATVSATNAVSSAPASDFSIAPDTVTLTSCNAVASVTLTGGSGTYYGAAGSNLIDVNSPGMSTTGVIRRVAGNANGVTSVNAAFSDGRTSKTVTVNLTGTTAGGAAGNCP